MKIAASACLLGAPCRFDGASKPCADVLALRDFHEVTPVCPEVAGGLSVPHPAFEIVAEQRALRVVDRQGADGTDAFLAGAQSVVDCVRAQGCQLAVLKSKSPSCGNGLIYDGTFTGTLVAGYGVAARALRAEGVRVLDENQLRACVAASVARDPGALPAVLASSSAQCPALQTERLVLRPLTEADIDDVFAYCSDPAIGPDAGWAPHRTREDARFFVEEIASAPHVFGIFERFEGGACGPCIGSIGLIRDPQRRNVDCLMLGYALAKRAWGRGYVTEAAREMIRYGFDELGLLLVSCTCYPFNDRSRRVIEKCGFLREGVLHAAEPSHDGTLQDLLLYCLAREDWRAERA